MQDWKTQIKNHPVFSTFETLIDKIDRLGTLKDKENISRLDRLKTVLERCLKVIDGANISYLTTQLLDNLNSSLSQISSLVDQIDPNTVSPEVARSIFDSMEPHLTQVLVYLGNIRAATAAISGNSSLEKIGSIRLNALKHAANIREVFSEELEELREDVSKTKTDIEGITASLAEERRRADELITNFQTEFNESQKKRNAEFSNKLTMEFIPRIEGELNRLEGNVQNVIDDVHGKFQKWTSQSEALMAQLKEHVKNAGLRSEAIAEKGLMTEYNKSSRWEFWTATFWSFVTAVVALIMVYIVWQMILLIGTKEHPFSAEQFLAKALLTAILVGVARWTAKLEKRHSDESKRYQQLALELTTMEPFIATLDEVERKEIRKALVPKYFVGKGTLPLECGKNSESEDDDPFKSSIGAVVQVAKDAVKPKD